MKASVAICTYNRCGFLKDSIKAVSEQQTDFEYEVLVVDNNSSDDTKSVVEDMCRLYSNVRYIHEPNQGLSYARNRALHEAAGEIIAYTDDDGLAQPGWLQGLIDEFGDTQVGGVAGKITLDLPKDAPSWLKPELHPYLAAYDKGTESIETSEFYGCNFAVRRELAIELGEFSVELGFNGGELLPGEETDLARRMILADHKIRYAPSAIVIHRISLSRLSEDWFRKRLRQQGRIEVLIGTIPRKFSSAITAAKERGIARASAHFLGRGEMYDEEFLAILSTEHCSGRLQELNRDLSVIHKVWLGTVEVAWFCWELEGRIAP